MKNNEIIVSESFQSLLKHLFGIRYHQYSGLKNFSEWKETIVKIGESIQKSIEYTIDVIDSNHKKCLMDECAKFIKEINEAKSIDQINEKAIIRLTYLIFFLMGEMPNHFNLESNIPP